MTLTVHNIPKIAGAFLHIYFEDTQYADAPARVLLHSRWPVEPARDGTLRITVSAPKEPCTVRAHLAAGLHTSITSGDYISTESYRCTDPLHIRLHPV